MKYELENSRLKVIADTMGAELVSVIADGRERLWQNRTGEWAGHAPVLFPVCGNCNMTEQGVSFPISRHGFARRSQFELFGQSENSLTFILRSSAETKKHYPYEFAFYVTYRISDKLEIVYEIENVGDSPMYASCGGHESFALSGGVGEYLLEFEKEENFSALLHDQDGRLTGETKAFGAGKILPLPEEFLHEDRALIFRVQSRSAILREKTGASVARITFDGFPYLLLWHPLDTQMICIEPWHNLPDGENKQDFSQKEGVFCVLPQKKVRFVRSVAYD